MHCLVSTLSVCALPLHLWACIIVYSVSLYNTFAVSLELVHSLLVLMIRTVLSPLASVKPRSSSSSKPLAENVQNSVTSKFCMPTSSRVSTWPPRDVASRPLGSSPAHRFFSDFKRRPQWAAPSGRLFNAGQGANFHFSARYSNRRPTYTRFGGRTSSGGIFENITARFSDPGTRMIIFVVVGLGGKSF